MHTVGMQAQVSIIAAMGKNRELGKSNQLLWHIPQDLKRFKRLTMGHPIIMGRKTWESLPPKFRPLPDRTNIVLSRSNLDIKGVRVTDSLEKAVAQAKEIDSQEIFVIGGAQVYEQVLPHANRLYLTLIDDEKEGDASFPPYEHLFTKKISEESGEHEGLKYRWVTLEK